MQPPHYASASRFSRMHDRLQWYIVGQGLGYAIDLGTFLLLIGVLNVEYPIYANIISKITSATITYFFHRRFSFPGRKKLSNFWSLISYCLIVSGNMALTSLLLYALIILTSLPEYLAKIIADIIGVAATYLAFRMIVFSRVTNAP